MENGSTLILNLRKLSKNCYAGDVPKVGYFQNIPDEFKIKSLYSNDLILNIASKSKEAVQKLKFLDSPRFPAAARGQLMKVQKRG